ncbi:MAG: glycosyltransferase [Candidatus Zambryskibacteria bacterium CG10_big_fil_rev_8_21_14_0_10_34_34]|uniref:Glycosyltransferase n=1 Tax=Candidatus Zambryskibacteria bacterium CG10_big_fil_rev_8_21_14_0_10_34_34 TaxID=1975114 RepID=A0A2H0R0J2_9BACT|nr:MAG: glycosyltransferase [Candidatus Zambryskibacteria bacterium CG10_big_fil_rev_8_21_14_0_10_34_34]
MKNNLNSETNIIEEIKNKINKIQLINPDLFDNINNSILQINKELNSIISFEENKSSSIKKLKKFDGIKKLQIGGGSRNLDGYINLDIFQPTDIVWDIRSGLPFQDNRFEEIFCEHFFEHLDFPKSAILFLNEAFRTIKKGGLLKIVVPDCGKSLKEYNLNNKKYFNAIKKICFSKRLSTMEINSNLDVINYLFRDQFDNPKYTVHWWGYDNKNLTQMLKNSGFNLVKKWKFDKIICNPKRKYYSLYLIAKK